MFHCFGTKVTILERGGHLLSGFDRDYTAIPRAVFTDPEVAAVGLSAAEARAKGREGEARC